MAQNDNNFYQAGGYPLAYYGPVTQPTLENQPFATKDMLDKKQDTLVSGENIKSLNEESLLGAGNLEIEGGGVIPITHSELKNLRDNNQLTPGAWYHITDYVTTTSQTFTQSAGHQFDIIVRADDESHLNENAYAAHHEDDTYFTNCKLEAWELKYSLDNDTDKFAWADSANGKGVIYYMKDEWNNECPYDFKNIKFNRYKITDCTKSPDLVGKYSTANDINYTVDESTTYWCYTFCVLDTDDNYAAHDVSVEQELYLNDRDYYNHCHDNVFKPYYTTVRYDKNIEVMKLPNNVCVTDTDVIEDEDAFNSYYFNTFGNGCYGNTFGDNCRYNAFGNNFGYNTFGDNCSYNAFGDNCRNNVFGNTFQNNTFGNYFQNNTFGNYCSRNTFGNDCSNNTFGNNCSRNTFGNNCYDNTFGNYIRQLTVFEGVQYCSVTGGSGNSSYVQNAQILNGTKGTDENNLLTITFVANVNYTQIAGLNSSGNLVIKNPMD